jgi:hypothetical protein
MWPHLRTPELDARLQLIAGYLLNKPYTSILDLNCGYAPLLKYVGYFNVYIGNDCDGEAIEHLRTNYPDGTWLHCDDADLKIDHLINCLLCLGFNHGNGEYQSSTIYETMLRLARDNKPQSIILGCHAGLDDPSVLAELNEVGYDTKFAWVVGPQKPTTKYAMRKIWILEWSS